mmetsp:Transcript_37810/g.89776  ORF Transcript_37810/g.89776 Transcript_37810/m.89776 type:complete len:441 (-) Transcript_37810:260-1582(-)
MEETLAREACRETGSGIGVCGLPSLKDIRQDCISTIMSFVDSPSTLLRLGATCHAVKSVLNELELHDAKKSGGVFERVAQRYWDNPDAKVYSGNWKELCYDDNSLSSYDQVMVKVPVSRLQLPENQFQQYEPHNESIQLAGHDFQVSAGILLQDGANVDDPTLSLALELSSPEVSTALALHVMITLERSEPQHADLVSGQHDSGELSRLVFSKFCLMTESHRLVLFKSCASCSTLLDPDAGYVCHRGGDPESSSSSRRRSRNAYVSVRIEALRAWGLHPEAPKAHWRRRNTTVVLCGCAPHAGADAPVSALRAVVRRCSSISDEVRGAGWRLLWHMTWTVHRSGAKREFESLCQSLAEAGLLQLLMHSCGTEKSEAFLLMAMKFVCCIAESEQQVAAMNRAVRPFFLTLASWATEIKIRNVWHPNGMSNPPPSPRESLTR